MDLHFHVAPEQFAPTHLPCIATLSISSLQWDSFNTILDGSEAMGSVILLVHRHTFGVRWAMALFYYTATLLGSSIQCQIFVHYCYCGE